MVAQTNDSEIVVLNKLSFQDVGLEECVKGKAKGEINNIVISKEMSPNDLPSKTSSLDNSEVELKKLNDPSCIITYIPSDHLNISTNANKSLEEKENVVRNTTKDLKPEIVNLKDKSSDIHLKPL